MMLYLRIKNLPFCSFAAISDTNSTASTRLAMHQNNFGDKSVVFCIILTLYHREALSMWVGKGSMRDKR